MLNLIRKKTSVTIFESNLRKTEIQIMKTDNEVTF